MMINNDLFTKMAQQSGYSSKEINTFLNTVVPNAQSMLPSLHDSNSLPSITPTASNPNSNKPVDVTQTYGQPSQYDVFSKNTSPASEFATQYGTPLTLPKGNWQVVSTYDQADPQGGYIGNYENQGWGNSVMVKNADTGEVLGFHHMAGVAVQPGQTIQGGNIGTTGFSGNATGPHLALEYYDTNGNPGDVLNTQYSNIVPHNPVPSSLPAVSSTVTGN